MYHRDIGGSGNAGTSVNLTGARLKWKSPSLDGSLYGEPLIFGTRVYVATENDTVYALSAANGAVVWRKHLAAAVPSSILPCGNISPTVGITSTPVIDAARHEMFVVADEYVSGGARHVLFGLGLSDGKVLLHQHVDPPGADRTAILNRASLTLEGGRVVFGYGGNSGDCSTYHGWVVSVPASGGSMSTFEVDSASGQYHGAVWMGGAAPVIDSTGDVWVATGNGSVTTSSGPYDRSDGVLELSSSLHLKQFFAPSKWYLDNAQDRDLGSSVPAVLPDGFVVQAGKSQTLYLLNGAKLGGIGGAVRSVSHFCGSVVDGGVAFANNVVYLPCEAGVESVRVVAAKRSVAVLWQAPTGAGGPPIVAGGFVWTISGSTLYGLDPRTGAAVQRLAIASNATDFPTPSVGDGLLVAPGGQTVFAFAG